MTPPLPPDDHLSVTHSSSTTTKSNFFALEDQLVTSTTTKEQSVTREELVACLTTLQRLVNDDRQGLELLTENERIALLKAAGRLSRPTKNDIFTRKKQARNQAASEKRARDRMAREKTGIRAARTSKVFEAPLQIQQSIDNVKQEMSNIKLHSFRNCYVCKAQFT